MEDIPEPESIKSCNVEIKFDADNNEAKPSQLAIENSEEEFYFGSEQTLTNAERMAEENGSVTFNIQERFWQAWLIDSLIEKGQDVTALQQSVDYASSLDRQADAKSQLWMTKLATNFQEDSIINHSMRNPLEHLIWSNSILTITTTSERIWKPPANTFRSLGMVMKLNFACQACHCCLCLPFATRGNQSFA